MWKCLSSERGKFSFGGNYPFSICYEGKIWKCSMGLVMEPPQHNCNLTAFTHGMRLVVVCVNSLDQILGDCWLGMSVFTKNANVAQRQRTRSFLGIFPKFHINQSGWLCGTVVTSASNNHNNGWQTHYLSLASPTKMKLYKFSRRHPKHIRNLPQ